MARKIVCLLLMQSFICKVLSSYAQPAMQQYLHLSGVPHTQHIITVPAMHPVPTNQPNLPNIAPTNQPRPTTGLPSLPALALPNLVSSLQQLQEKPKTSVAKNPNPSSIDSNLLNNLAIALQLLIVSNILNAPPPDLAAAKAKKDVRACSEQNTSPQYSQYETVMPNSNFVGTSSFAEPNLYSPSPPMYKPTRNSMSLMSPYEALSPSSPYSDPILSQYGSVNPRPEFQSPYAMIDNDLFSMNDLY